MLWLGVLPQNANVNEKRVYVNDLMDMLGQH
jgi:hypothetical protein